MRAFIFLIDAVLCPNIWTSRKMRCSADLCGAGGLTQTVAGTDCNTKAEAVPEMQTRNATQVPPPSCHLLKTTRSHKQNEHVLGTFPQHFAVGLSVFPHTARYARAC